VPNMVQEGPRPIERVTLGRILRYFRFLARFGVADAASADYAACIDKAPTLMALSRNGSPTNCSACSAPPIPSPRCG